MVALEKMKELKARQQYLRESLYGPARGPREPIPRGRHEHAAHFQGGEQGLSTEEMGNIAPCSSNRGRIRNTWSCLNGLTSTAVSHGWSGRTRTKKRTANSEAEAHRSGEGAGATAGDKDQYLTELDKIAKTKEHIENMRKKLTDPEATPKKETWRETRSS